MQNRIVQIHAPAGRHADFSASVGWRSVPLFLLAWTAVFSASAAWGHEPLIRREAPFPAVFAPSSAHDTDEPVRYEVLRGDFHMHTPYSDGTIAPVDRVMEAWRYGYDVIAITDHGNFRAYEEALSTAEALGVVLIRGMETGLSGKEHLVALDFSADYQPRNPHHWAETEEQERVFYREQWSRLAAASGYVLYAHPHVGLRETMLLGIDQGLLRGIEVKNDVVGSRWNTVESYGTHWYPFALDWAVEHNLTIFANSDVHRARDDAEQAVTLVLTRDRSREAVREAFEAGRTVAWFNGMLCGHEWVLDALMADLVDIRLIEIEGDRLLLRLQNHSPLALTAEIAGMPVDLIELGVYQKVLVDPRRMQDTVTITWKNLWIRSTENLTTMHRVVTAGV